MDVKEDLNATVREFESEVRAFVAAHSLLEGPMPVVVALSGGADSVALLAALVRLGCPVVAAHCNFGLRGRESDRDQQHCMAVTARLETDLLVRHFDIPSQSLPGESVEMACRRLRYEWFRKIADAEGAQAIAVGHHREDRVETFFLNLMRGAGITGLTSMNPRSGDVVRPLLAMSRKRIEDYVAALGLGYVTDSTNADSAFRRNALRNIIIPTLEAHFPEAVDSVLKSIANLASARQIYRRAIEAKKEKYTCAEGIDIAALACEPEAATILLEIIGPLGFTPSQCADILRARSGASFPAPSGALRADLSRGILAISDADGNLAQEAVEVSLLRDITSPIFIGVSRHHIATFSPRRDPAAAYFDKATALDRANRWELRHYRRGDRMTPFGAAESKLVSDIFADAKLSAAQKQQAWLLTCNGEIVWIPGIKNGAFAPVGPRSKAYIELRIKQ